MAESSHESLNSSTEENTSEPTFRATRNYTGEDEKGEWWYMNRWTKDWKTSYPPILSGLSKQGFRERRGYYEDYRRHGLGAFRISFENSNEIGAFIKLTNNYCLVCCGEESANFLNTLKGDLPDIPFVNATIAGCRVVGRMCVGNRRGLILPDTVYETEIQHIKSELPESVKVETVEERLSALGNVIVCNDKIALIHPDIDKESEEKIADTLQVETFRHMIANNPLVGSYCVLNNKGGLIHPKTTNSELEILTSLLQLPLASGTVNRGSNVLASGLAVNDWIAYAGMKTTSHEFSIIDKIFKFSCA